MALLHPGDSDESGEAFLLAQSLLPFCFPLGQYTENSAPWRDSPHYFVVSDSEGAQKHGFCRPLNVVRPDQCLTPDTECLELYFLGASNVLYMVTCSGLCSLPVSRDEAGQWLQPLPQHIFSPQVMKL